MKKAVLLCLFACLLGAVFAGTETEEATPFFWPDITGKVLFSMTEPELGALKGFEEEAYISTSHFDDLAYEITATVFDNASQSKAARPRGIWRVFPTRPGRYATSVWNRFRRRT
ncbi:MAG: hypothetical protein K5784_02070 [Clostridiales bacterium]|nr:hypothetical protein [Clostridiales bacterium]